jgi:2-keto-4-pentenoate hydratase/2-oxohepta-3-ene-1,7-dioic acid hydratase in catechol pathway
MGFRLANVEGRAALVSADAYYDLAELSGGDVSADPMEALGNPERLAELAAGLDAAEPTGNLADVTLGPPVPRPQKVFGIGLNYQDHASEGSMDLPEKPLVFTKFPSCLVGPTAEVELRSDGVDYEGELVVVIGPGGKDIAAENAWSHVVGLTIGQDVSDRPVQFAAKPPHFDLGKSFDTFGPMGPVLVSTDEFDDPNDLHLTTSVNGEVRQDDRTSSLIFDVPTLINYLSRITTLVPGDVIFTGTPAGVGVAQGKLLADGDVIDTTIEGIGAMRNVCRRVSDH